MMRYIDQWVYFIKTGIWQIKREDVSPLRYFVLDIVKKVLLAVEWFLDKRMFAAASALTYSTLLAIVPVVAVLFAIARGFGFNKYIEQWFMAVVAATGGRGYRRLCQLVSRTHAERHLPGYRTVVHALDGHHADQ